MPPCPEGLLADSSRAGNGFVIDVAPSSQGGCFGGFGLFFCFLKSSQNTSDHIFPKIIIFGAMLSHS